jgi:Domain of unknown function (DUF5666)
MNRKIAFIGGATIAFAVFTALVPALVSAQTTSNQTGGFAERGAYTPPAARGTVASVSGNTITLTGSDGTTYTVDATNATISKFVNGSRKTIQASDVQTGDTLSVFGTASGTNITATRIIDGAMARTGNPGASGMGRMGAPAATGTVASISGSSITVTGANGTTYTVDATGATISKFATNALTTIQVSDIQTGDTLTVFGTASGSNVTATRIIDGVMPTRNGRGNAKMPPATTTKPKKISVSGTVASISGTTIMLTGKDGTSYTIDASKTRFTRRNADVMAISDIQTGDALTVAGTVTGANITAMMIRDTSMGTKRDHTTGTITAVNGASFTLTTKANAALTVNTTSTTVIEKMIEGTNTKQPATINDLAVGENMLITGAVDSASNTIDASIVRIMIQRVSKTGVVQSVSGNVITLTAKDGTTFTADATGAKLMRRYGASIVDVSEIQNGDTLVVAGTMNGTTLTILSIRDNSLQARNGTFVGSVTAVNGASFTIQSKSRGVQTANTTSTTVFKKGSAAATLADVAVGQTVTVTGVWDRATSNVTASKVMIKQ